ncbi:hypothetical protein BOX15_Mlig007860g1 [Macrostomum lignano]|uniref:DUF4062 domain-containing protein n=1 Tax=Macrostomum lignano TaxID=282301 RepID=A0A267F4I5_9PLAT|nr:hypothetical protein BOX15_Mlig007860g1 [Macrostomum lignano]
MNVKQFSQPEANRASAAAAQLQQLRLQAADADASETQLAEWCLGRPDNAPKQRSNQVRLFLSSTFSDFRAERNYLTEHAFSELKSYCATLGLEFRVCDMRWGVTDAAKSDHVVESLCLSEIERCERRSVGPFFVALLGNRYGYQPVPPSIEQSEFDILLEFARKFAAQHAEILADWYRLDENAQPPVYQLRPIRSRLPAYANYSDEAARRKAGSDWWDIEEALRNCLRRSASKAAEAGSISQESLARYLRSVTEAEVIAARQAASGRPDNQLVYIRELTDLCLHHEAAEKYTDLVLQGENLLLNTESASLLKSLKQSIKSSSMRWREFLVPWDRRGVVPEGVEQHQRYLANLSRCLVSDVSRMIDQTIAAGGLHHHQQQQLAPMLALQDELGHHAAFCRDRLRQFCGRETELNSIKECWLNGGNANQTVVVWAPSGHGKTALVSRVAQVVPEWFGRDCVVALRYVGTSPASTDSLGVLSSLCRQICLAYRLKWREDKAPRTAGAAKEMLHRLIITVARDASRPPLLLLLDSLDQARDPMAACSWLPNRLPANARALLSVLPGRLLDRLRAGAHGSGRQQAQHQPKASSSQSCFVQLEPMDSGLAGSIAEVHLAARGRRVTPRQMAALLADGRESALALRLSLDRACRWASYDEVNSENEGGQKHGGALALIGALFDALEDRYGQLMVRLTLGFITVGVNGLSELELEDALSCQDDLLNELYRYHDPPIKGVVRVPPLLWSRMQQDIGDFVVTRITDGKATLMWYHRLFREAAERRYAPPEAQRDLHQRLSQIYTSEGPIRRTIRFANVKRSLVVPDADRLVSWAPLSPKQPRKLRCLFRHLLEAGMWDQLIDSCAASLRYLQAAIDAFGCAELLAQLDDALRRADTQLSPTSELPFALRAVHDCVSFARNWLDPGDDRTALPVQLLGQLRGLDGWRPLQSLCRQCVDYLIGGSSYAAAEAPRLLPAMACFPTCLADLKWSLQSVAAVWTRPWDSSRLAVLISNSSASSSSSATAGAANQLRLYSADTLAAVCSVRLESTPLDVAMCPHAALLAVLDQRYVRLYDWDTGQVLCKHGVNINNKLPLNRALAVSRQANWLAIAAEDRIALLVNSAYSAGKLKMPANQKKSEPASSFSVHHKQLLIAKGVESTFQLAFPDTETENLLVSLHHVGLHQKHAAVKCWKHDEKLLLWTREFELPSAQQQALLPGFACHPSVEDLLVLVLSDCRVLQIEITSGQVLQESSLVDGATIDRPVLSSFQFSDDESVQAAVRLGPQSLVVRLSVDGNHSRQSVALTTAPPVAQPPDDVQQQQLAPHQHVTVGHLSPGGQLVVCGSHGGLLAANSIGLLDLDQPPWQQAGAVHAHSASVDFLLHTGCGDSCGDNHDGDGAEGGSGGGFLTFSRKQQCLRAWQPGEAQALSQADYRRLLPCVHATAYCLDSERRRVLLCTGACLTLLPLRPGQADPQAGVTRPELLRLTAASDDPTSSSGGADDEPPGDGPKFDSVDRLRLLQADQYAVMSDSEWLYVLEMDSKRLVQRVAKPLLWEKFPTDSDQAEAIVAVFKKQVKSDKYLQVSLLSVPNLTPMRTKTCLPPLIGGGGGGQRRWQLTGLRTSDSGDTCVLEYTVGGTAGVSADASESSPAASATKHLFAVNFASPGTELVACVASDAAAAGGLGGRRRTVASLDSNLPVYPLESRGIPSWQRRRLPALGRHGRGLSAAPDALLSHLAEAFHVG